MSQREVPDLKNVKSSNTSEQSEKAIKSILKPSKQHLAPEDSKSDGGIKFASVNESSENKQKAKSSFSNMKKAKSKGLNKKPSNNLLNGTGISQERKKKILKDREYNKEGYTIDINSASPLVLQNSIDDVESVSDKSEEEKERRPKKNVNLNSADIGTMFPTKSSNSKDILMKIFNTDYSAQQSPKLLAMMSQTPTAGNGKTTTRSQRNIGSRRFLAVNGGISNRSTNNSKNRTPTEDDDDTLIYKKKNLPKSPAHIKKYK